MSSTEPVVRTPPSHAVAFRVETFRDISFEDIELPWMQRGRSRDIGEGKDTLFGFTVIADL